MNPMRRLCNWNFDPSEDGGVSGHSPPDVPVSPERPSATRSRWQTERMPETAFTSPRHRRAAARRAAPLRGRRCIRTFSPERAGFAGARVCDPQRVASRTEAETNFQVTQQSTRCGSQSRAPEFGASAPLFWLPWAVSPATYHGNESKGQKTLSKSH